MQSHIEKAMNPKNPRWNVSFEMNGYFERKLPPKHKKADFLLNKTLDPTIYADCLTK